MTEYTNEFDMSEYERKSAENEPLIIQLKELNSQFRIMNKLLLDISRTLKELIKVVNQ